MIVSFACKQTQKIWNGERVKKFPPSIQHSARRKLRMLNNAHAPEDLRVPPGNQLEKPQGSRVGQYSIRVNDQWRICFKWHNEAVHEVEIVDYH